MNKRSKGKIYEEKGKEAQKLLNKLKGKYQSDERKNDESR